MDNFAAESRKLYFATFLTLSSSLLKTHYYNRGNKLFLEN